MDNKPGTTGWIDMVTTDAKEVQEFYAEVVGWMPSPVSMGDYEDYTMMSGDQPTAGVCHHKGVNSDIPPAVWMVYINVADLDKSLVAVEKRGGKQLTNIKDMGSYGRACYIEDPGGARCALFEPRA